MCKYWNSFMGCNPKKSLFIITNSCMFWLVAPRHRTKRVCLCYMDLIITPYRLNRFPHSPFPLLLFITSPSLQSLAHPPPLSLSSLFLSLDRKIKTLPFTLRSPAAKKIILFFLVGILLEIKNRRLYYDMHEKKTQLGHGKIQVTVAVTAAPVAVEFDGEGIF